MIRDVKSEIRILGFDDAPFTFKDKNTILIGVICRGGTQIDGVISTKISVDGTDVTSKMARLVKNNKHFGQLRLIMLDGITFGGFNIVDTKRLYKLTGLPVIVIIRNKPDLKSIMESLKKFRDMETRWKKIEKAGEIHEFKVKNKVLKGEKKIYYQNIGLSQETSEKIINLTAIHSVTPEPVRIAHLMGYALKGVL